MKHRAVFVALLTILSAPSASSGQENYREWLGLCLGPDAGFDACANISIWTRFDPVTEYTYATYQVSNLQGWAPLIPNSGATSLYGFYLYGIQYTPPSWNPDIPYYYNSLVRGQASTVGNAEILRVDPYISFTRERMIEGDNNIGSRVYGCDGAPEYVVGREPYSPTVGVNTCHGALRVEFEWVGRVQLQDEMIAGFTASSNGPDGERLGGACTTAGSCVTVTPEPSTWLMLATGLLGLGWFSRRRKTIADA